MAAPRRTPQEMLARLDLRHDELLSRLDDLNTQILAALEELASKRPDDSVAKTSGRQSQHTDAAVTC